MSSGQATRHFYHPPWGRGVVGDLGEARTPVMVKHTPGAREGGGVQGEGQGHK